MSVPHSDPRSHVAAIDLGSNSFHMVIARQTGHDLQILDRLRQPVRLAAGLDAEHRVAPAASERAFACLQQFGERLEGIPRERVRAVGTNTLRRIRSADGFRAEAESALGHPIEVISGIEEARLIYLGVAHTLPAERSRRLVIDIGGGSTELILGTGFDVEIATSMHMGCVTFSQRFFDGGSTSRENFRSAQTAAAVELQRLTDSLRGGHWDLCIGASGTLNSIAEILRQNGISDGGITHAALKRLRKLVVAASNSHSLELPGLKAERRAVLPGGLAILLAITKGLQPEVIQVSSGALREGVLYDLLGRIRHEDVRDRTIRRFVEQYRVDLAQSERVEGTAQHLLAGVMEAWSLPPESSRRQLRWAASLHEIGLAVAHSGYHRHGGYLLAESDMPGFSRDGQSILAAIVRGHRRKLRLDAFENVNPSRREQALRLCALLRLACLLHRSRTPTPAPQVTARQKGLGLHLEFEAGWLEDHALTLADLEEETVRLRAVGIRLSFGPEPTPAAPDPRGSAPPAA